MMKTMRQPVPAVLRGIVAGVGAFAGAIVWPTSGSQAAVWLFVATGGLVVAGIFMLRRPR